MAIFFVIPLISNNTIKLAQRLQIAAKLLSLGMTAYSFPSVADVYATFESGRDGIVLMTDKCPDDTSGLLKHAISKFGPNLREGCYLMNNRSNPVVKWDDGTIQELDASMFHVDPKQAIVKKEMHIEPSATPSVASEASHDGIYWATNFDAIAAGMEHCKHFNTPSLEEQRDKLAKKYGDDLKDAKILTLEKGSRVFTAYRHNQETGEDIKYAYFDSLNACEDFQSKVLHGSLPEWKAKQ